ncbi:MAG: hypothetical protein ACLQNE_22485 [Thermoguttaceae bacterium]|jgi:hypothetical protein
MMNQYSDRFCDLRMVLALMFPLAATSIRAEPPDVRIRKKLIATGWDHPDAEGLLKHLSAMEKQPFDGVVLEVTGRTAKGEALPLSARAAIQVN